MDDILDVFQMSGIKASIHHYYSKLLQDETKMSFRIQQKYNESLDGLQSMADVSNFRYMHTYLFPIALLFGTKSYLFTVIGTVFPHILSIWLKWLFAADRPYWWVHTSNSYGPVDMAPLHQTEMTCQTSWGFPSSEHTVLGAVAYLCIFKPIREWKKRFLYDMLAILISLCFMMHLTVSHIAMGLNFFHQCYVGIAIGLLFSLEISERKCLQKICEFQKLSAGLWYLTLVLTSVAVYALAYHIVADPRASIHLAFNYCHNPLHPKPDSTDTYWIVHDCGLLFGTLFFLPLNAKHGVQPELWKTVCFIIAALHINLSIEEYIPRTEGVIVFFASTFLARAFYVSFLIKGTGYFTKSSPLSEHTKINNKNNIDIDTSNNLDEDQLTK